MMMEGKSFDYFSDGVRISSSNTIESLLEDDFKLIINDNEYVVTPPLQERCTTVSLPHKDESSIRLCIFF